MTGCGSTHAGLQGSALPASALPGGRRPAATSGQGLVEFALVVPLFILLLVGIAQFGQAWMTRNIMTGATREAVRIAAVQGNGAAALSRANLILASAGISGASVNLFDDGAPFGTCRVSVSCPLPLTIAGFLPGLHGSSIMLSTSTSMRKEF